MTRVPEAPSAPAELMTKIAELSGALATEREERVRLERVLAQALAKEQQRVAELLHDSLTQSLTAARIHARLCKRQLQSGVCEPEGLDELERVLEISVDELQGLMRWLRSSELETTRLEAALADLAAFAAIKVPTRFIAPKVPIVADRAIELQLLRVAQLTLFDIVRHRTADAVVLILASDGPHVVLTVQEHAASPTPRAWNSLLEQEVTAIRGAYTFQAGDANPPGGASVVCRLPARLEPSLASDE